MSKHAFGAKANVEAALQEGKIGAFDILLLNEGEFGWVDKNGNVVYPETKKILFVEALPETGEEKTVYVYNNKFYFWDGADFITPSTDGAVDETTVDSKIDAAKVEVSEAANSYTDEQIAEAIAVVEF